MTEPRREPAPDQEPVARPPVTFWIMIVLAVLYLGWRLVQGVIWLVQQIT